MRLNFRTILSGNELKKANPMNRKLVASGDATSLKEYGTLQIWSR